MKGCTVNTHSVAHEREVFFIFLFMFLSKWQQVHNSAPGGPLGSLMAAREGGLAGIIIIKTPGKIDEGEKEDHPQSMTKNTQTAREYSGQIINRLKSCPSEWESPLNNKPLDTTSRVQE